MQIEYSKLNTTNQAIESIEHKTKLPSRPPGYSSWLPGLGAPLANSLSVCPAVDLHQFCIGPESAVDAEHGNRRVVVARLETIANHQDMGIPGFGRSDAGTFDKD